MACFTVLFSLSGMTERGTWKTHVKRYYGLVEIRSRYFLNTSQKCYPCISLSKFSNLTINSFLYLKKILINIHRVQFVIITDGKNQVQLPVHYSLYLSSVIHSSMALQPFVGTWPLLQFRNLFYTDGRTPLTSDQPIARPLPAHRTTQTE
jgi:hypothetical protein